MPTTTHDALSWRPYNPSLSDRETLLYRQARPALFVALATGQHERALQLLDSVAIVASTPEPETAPAAPARSGGLRSLVSGDGSMRPKGAHS